MKHENNGIVDYIFCIKISQRSWFFFVKLHSSLWLKVQISVATFNKHVYDRRLKKHSSCNSCFLLKKDAIMPYQTKAKEDE
mgnify:CR=1 FL=1